MAPRLRLSAALLTALAGHAAAQCGPQALYELGGAPGPVCPATFGTQVLYEAVARGHFVSIESSPTGSGSPAFMGRVALQHPALALASEVPGRIWACDGGTLYAIDTLTPSSPQIIGQIAIHNEFWIDHLRVRGNYVYAASDADLYIVDATNPAAPILRSTFVPSPFAWMYDLEVVGSYAYLAISESPSVNTILVLDISNPSAPVEVRRVGNANREGLRVSKAPGLPGLYALARNSAAGAVELWSLANPANPVLTAVNATLTSDLDSNDALRATNTIISAYLTNDNSLNNFNVSSLSRTAPPITFTNDDWIANMGADSPYVFLTRATGETARINVNTAPPAVTNPYFDVFPGVAKNVLTLNEGFSILTGLNDLWLFATPNGLSPQPVAHVKPGANFRLDGPAALVTGGTLYVVEHSTSGASVSRIISYHVDATGLTLLNFFDVSGYIWALEPGVDSAGARRLFYTFYASGSPGTLRTLNAANPAALSQMSSFSLSTGVGDCLKFLPGNTFTGTPPRILAGGFSGATQIVNVASSAAPSVLGVIPSSASVISNGLIPTVWLLDNETVRGYDISNPATPVLQSSTIVARNSDRALDIKVIELFGRVLAVTTEYGDLVKIDVTNPTSPFVTQIARINTAQALGAANALAYDGTNLHIANGADGYTILPYTISAPREDPNHSLYSIGTQGVVPICTGTPLHLTATFAANPAVTSYQWQKRPQGGIIYTNLANGPTGSGSTISGATTATLTISNPGPADAGAFICQASNSCATVTTDTAVEARPGGYANCDRSTTHPVLNVNDFVCFQSAFAANNPSANCDGSTATPILNVNDFICFQQRFAAGCP